METQTIAKSVIKVEIQRLMGLRDRIGSSITKAVDMVLHIEDRVIICGKVKSGLIARKIAATSSSAGTPSYFLHPGEAFHGDLRRLTNKKVMRLFK